MTSSHQISFVNKVPRTDIHHAIRSVGGRNANGTIWRLPLADAISKMIDGTYRFFVSVGGHTVNVQVAKSSSGHLYLKTAADGLYVDNLLNLPEFPA